MQGAIGLVSRDSGLYVPERSAPKEKPTQEKLGLAVWTSGMGRV